MTDPAKITAGLSEAQREAFARMNVKPPLSILPNYYSVEFFGGDLPGVAAELQALGLVTLPIASDRHAPTYYGEIHPLGLAVRAILQEEDDVTR